MTGFVPVMWAMWGFCIFLLAAVSLYASRLSRDEEDQIFLGEGFTEERSAQAAIAAKMDKIQPYKRMALWLVGAMTLFIVAYYIFDIFRQFK